MRRSVRKYSNKNVDIKYIKEIIKDACYAPSSCNNQPWEFILITNKEIKNEIVKIHKYSSMLLETEFTILVCCNQKNADSQEFWVQDCAAATENILLSATKYDLGSVWIGVYPNKRRVERIQEILNLPCTIIPFAMVVVGYSDLEIQPKRIKEKNIYLNGYVSPPIFVIENKII